MFIIFFAISFEFNLFVISWIKESLSSKSVFRIPIICVGNIYVGGTGKTPLSILITKELLKIKKNQLLLENFIVVIVMNTK